MFDSIITYLSTHSPALYLTQSLWRDEAFSVLLAEPGNLTTIKTTALDFNPPLYYLLLHYWMAIFGKSEIAIRMLSFVFFLGFLYIFYKFAKAVFKGIWPQVALLLAAVNPMLLYYGFEARMYSLYTLTTTASMYYFYTKRWKAYLIATTLALYTHPYTVFVPLVQAVYLLLTKRLTKQMLKMIITPFIVYLPWILVILQQFKRSGQMWIYPVNMNLVLSALGNLFTGYEGTPGFLWNLPKTLSLIFIIIFVYLACKKGSFQKNLLFFLWVFLPLGLILTASVFKPLYVNRYLITVSVALIFLLILGITSFSKKLIRITLAFFLILFSTFLLLYLPYYIKKVNIRETFFFVNNLIKKDDLVLARSPLVFFESLYYSPNRSKVFLYNPDHVNLPYYLGTILIPQDRNLDHFPKYPQRAFMVYEDGTYQIFTDYQKK